MNRHKQVLQIGRAVLGRGCNYSEPNMLTRRIKYYGLKATPERLAALRAVLNCSGLNEVVVKATANDSCYGSTPDYSITLFEPKAWFTEE